MSGVKPDPQEGQAQSRAEQAGVWNHLRPRFRRALRPGFATIGGMVMAVLHRSLSALCFALGALACASLVAPRAHAHPLKLSVTEATYNRDNGRLELAIRFFIDDFEAALSAVAKHPVSVSKPDELSPIALDYIRAHFLVKSEKGQAQRLEWAGMDTTDTQVWIFCECPLPGGLIGSRLEVTLLQEAYADQINTVKLRDGAFKQTLIFGTGTGELVIKGR